MRAKLALEGNMEQQLLEKDGEIKKLNDELKMIKGSSQLRLEEMKKELQSTKAQQEQDQAKILDLVAAATELKVLNSSVTN